MMRAAIGACPYRRTGASPGHALTNGAFMRVGVRAAGAVGGDFGGRLAAAGHEVIFFARGKNLEALRRSGLKIESVKGDLHLPKINVTDEPKSVAPVDIVLFAVKLWDTENAAELIRPI